MTYERAFLDQNTQAAETLTLDDIPAGLAGHHSGGLTVLAAMTPGGWHVKMHDSWGDEGTVVVHIYPPEPINGDGPWQDGETVEHFPTGREALARFRQAVAS